MKAKLPLVSNVKFSHAGIPSVYEALEMGVTSVHTYEILHLVGSITKGTIVLVAPLPE